MKELHNLVNIIPVIAKADTLTRNEIKRLKQKVSTSDYDLSICLRNALHSNHLQFQSVNEICVIHFLYLLNDTMFNSLNI